MPIIEQTAKLLTPFGSSLIGSSPGVPITSSSQIPNSLASGAYYVAPTGYTGTPIQTYIDNSTTGGKWMLAMVVTNVDGDEADWFNNDSWVTPIGSPDYFTQINTLNTSFLTGLNKKNSKHPLVDYYSFSEMLIRENFEGTVGTKAYTLNTTKSLRARWTDGSNPADGDQGYNNQVSSIIGTTGTMGGTFYTNTLDFNYSIQNDGGRIAATPISTECVGGISTKVDNGRGYGWKGNLTRSDSGRAYANDGTTTDHTVWIFLR
jgi:hypothetical protein